MEIVVDKLVLFNIVKHFKNTAASRQDARSCGKLFGLFEEQNIYVTFSTPKDVDLNTNMPKDIYGQDTSCIGLYIVGEALNVLEQQVLALTQLKKKLGQAVVITVNPITTARSGKVDIKAFYMDDSKETPALVEAKVTIVSSSLEKAFISENMI
ncbi:hypothetical protein EIN_425440 [Entamoeba invadens IP1]|uniref:Uncharacterized protein n=1 Tax=Entamoeba invadens IP1 TaxID=370355 RepID=A0A0A1U615_ENTIV|nr:hypothetical protein EIN_425440 [Entamoeba invadens IP1]ELP89812.1 hypothetical protein EIN_425440 [Entamoeba invadens IP1]|eukprot:XP_004256583.1 hypothetical protein EIN_425440 [Entamoeba invadens IP1]